MVGATGGVLDLAEHGVEVEGCGDNGPTGIADCAFGVGGRELRFGRGHVRAPPILFAAVGFVCGRMEDSRG